MSSSGRILTIAGIAPSGIVNADVATAAAIALSKLAPGSSGVLKSNGSAISAGNLIVSADITDGTIVNADISASAVLEAIKLSSFAVGCRSNANTSVANTGLTAVAFGSQILAKTPSGYTAMHNTSSNNTRLTAHVAGLYLFLGIVGFASGGGGNYRGAQFVKGGVTSLGANQVPPVGGGAVTTVIIFGMADLAATNYVELYGAQDGSGALNAASGESYMYGVLLGG